MDMRGFAFAFIACCYWGGFDVCADQSGRNVRTFVFNAKSVNVPFAQTLPSKTQLFKTWPKEPFRIDLPDSIQAVGVHNEGNSYTLMGPPIHIQSGDRLKLTLRNHVPYTGLSIHLHGFQFGGAFEYAGAVGVSQCPLSEQNEFTYDVAADDRPGTYWYHTSAGHFGVDAYDALRGPLLVHPSGTQSEDLVNILNAQSSLPLGYSPLAYKNERILFLQDGFLSAAAGRYSQHVGNLVPPPSKSDEGIIVATSHWQFGTCNGKLRDVIHVAPNQKFKFRLINGGQHHALRVSIDRFPLTIVAMDSQPVEAYTVDEVVVHVGERFDVEVNIFNDVEEGEGYWIRASSLESQSQGFENGIRAIMRVSDLQSIPLDEDVPDPGESVVAQMSKHRDEKILNCHAPNPECIPITSLTPLSINHGAKQDNIDSEIHTIDTYFQPAPQYGHFISINESALYQNELPPAAMISRSFRPSKSVHPNSMALRVARSSSVIIVWRTSLLMDVPVHLHGHSVEVLDVAIPDLRQDCNLQACRLSQAYASKEKIKSLDKIPPGLAIEKDTFIIPAGGAVVTRIHTGKRGIWLATGQKDIHGEDGMSFVMIVGDYKIPRVDNWPADFPTCDSPLVKSTSLKPHCQCYIDKDAPFQLEMPDEKYCSRSHLCRHELSHTANLESHVYGPGFNIQSGSSGMPDFAVAVIFFFLVLTSVVLITVLPSRSSHSNITGLNDEKKPRRSSSLGIGSRISQRRNAIIRSNIDIDIGSTGGSSSIPGMSHIGTVEHIHEEEEGEDDEEEESDVEIDPDAPPPPPHEREDSTAHQQTDDEESMPPVPQRQPNPQTGDQLLNRQSTISTFDRIFSERGNDGEDNQRDLKNAFEFLLDGYTVKGKLEIKPVDDEIVHRGSSFTKQMLYLLPVQWAVYFPTCVNALRFVEVGGLAFVTGAVFRHVGSERGQSTIAELSSLMLVLTTTWTFCRLFSSIPCQHTWFKSIQVIFRQKRFSLTPVFVARTTVVMFCESGWCILAVCVCLPIAGLVGDLRLLCNISLLLTSNNICYLSLGALLGTFSSVPYGMIAATFFSQVSILASGIFTELPPSIAWARYFSPFYWTVRGLVKTFYQSSDTYDCVNGSSSEIGSNQCFIEYDPLIEQYKRRGFHIATHGDAADLGNVVNESIALAALSFGLQMIMFGRCFFTYYRLNWEEMKGRYRQQ